MIQLSHIVFAFLSFYYVVISFGPKSLLHSNLYPVACRINTRSRQAHSMMLTRCRASAKSTTDKALSFFCDSCGAEMIKWMGRCPHCKEWNTIKEFKQVKFSPSSLDPRTIAKASGMIGSKQIAGSGRWIISESENSTLIPMSSIQQEQRFDRLPTFSKELDRVLGGGLVKGSVSLVAGEPGIGKSTLLLQLASALARRNVNAGSGVVYLSGEENPEQIAMRSKRLNLYADNTFLICDVDIDAALSNIAAMSVLPSVIIVDSIQTVRSANCDNAIGSVTQIRECAAKLVQFAKATGIAVVLVGHVTKSGDVAGPRILEHMVDTVLYMEGSEQMDYRLVKSQKNRFGSIAEVGVFTMSEEGMTDVLNPSELFLTSSAQNEEQEGSAVVIIMEGTRPLLAEIQCLVSVSHNTHTGKMISKRASDGFPMQRLLLICAVIEKRLKLSMWNRDVYLNVVGGLRLTEPSSDCAVAASIVSSLTNTPIRSGTAFIGELGLGGELRGGKKIEQRIHEAVKAGFKRVIVPVAAGKSMSSNDKLRNIEVVPCHNLKEVVAAGLLTHNVEQLLSSQRRKRNFNTEQEPHDLEEDGQSGEDDA